MARAISYFIFSSNGSYLRWDDDTTIDFRIRQYEMSITGGGGVDRLYVGAGTKVDAGALFASANTDELYLSGSFSDYTQTISAGGVYTFTGLAGGSHAGEVVSFSMNSNGDKLVFANGHITVKSSDYLSVSGSYSSISAGSLTIVAQTDPTSGAQPGNKPAKVFVFDAGGINIPQLPIVDEAIAVSGGGGVDKFYVRKGTNADAIGLFASAGQDVLYLTGRFSDYTQTKSAGGVYTFTRNFTGADASLTEVVSFSMNSSGDQLVFADGGVTLRLADYLTGGSYADITAGQLNPLITTPGLLATPTPNLILASDTGSSASDRITNNATINVTGLVTGGTWQYQVDSSAWATGTASSLIASSGPHTYFVRQIDAAGNTSAISTAVTYTLDNTLPTVNTTTFSVAENTTAVGTLAANETVTWSLGTGADTGLFGLTNGVLSFTTAPNYEMPRGSAFNAASNNDAYTVNVTATDTAGNVKAQVIVVNVTDVNEAPTVVAQTPTSSVLVNQAANLNVANAFGDPDTQATDATWRTLTYVATGLPSGLSINASTGVIGGTATATTASAASVTVTATDGGGRSVTETFSLSVVSALSAPVVQSFTVSDTTLTNGAQVGKSGEPLIFVATMSEAVTVTPATGAGAVAPQITFSVNGVAVTATYASGSGTSVLTFTGGTVPATGNGTAISVTSIALNGGTVTGNLSTQGLVTTSVGQTYAGYTVDNTLPTVNTTTFSVAENTTAVGTLAANETVTWSLGTGADTGLFTLTNGVLSFTTAPNYEMPRGSAFNAASNNDAYTVNVTATDTAGNVKAQAIVVNVTDVNEAPTVVAQTPSSSVLVNQAANLNVANAFGDPDTQATDATWRTLTYVATGLPSGLSINTSTGVIGGTATATTASAASVTVTATDGGGRSVTETFSLSVVSALSAPVVQSFTVSDTTLTNGAQVGKSGEPLVFVATMSEAVTVVTSGGTPSITFSVNGVAVTATYASGSGTSVLTFTGGTVPATGSGTAISVTSIALNGGTVTGNLSAQGLVTTSVGQTYAGYTVDNTAPTVNTTTFSVEENTTAVGTLAANETVTWSLGTGADTGLFTLTNGVLSFTTAPNYEMPRGSAFNAASNNDAYTVNVTATDTAGNVKAQAIVVNVTDVNEAPTVVAQTPTSSVSVNQAVNLNVASAFSDPDSVNTYAVGSPQWGTLTYVATGLPSGLSINANTGVIGGTATATTASAASVTVTATDGGGRSVTETFSLSVVSALSAPVVQSFTVSDTTLTNGAQVGKSGEALVFVATMSEAVTVVTSGGTPSIVFSVNGVAVTATYASGSGASMLTFTGGTVPATGNGTAISITSIALNGGTVTGNLSAQGLVTTSVGQTYAGYTVDNTAPTVNTTTFSVEENTTAVGTLAANETVTWSLGTGADTGLFGLTGGVLSFSAAPNFEMPRNAAFNLASNNNAYTVNVTATDTAGNVKTQAIVVNVTDVNEAPTVVAQTPTSSVLVNQAVNLNVASAFSDPDSVNTYAVGSPQWGTLTYVATGLPSGLSINASTGVIGGTATATTASAVSVTVTATDGGGRSITETFSLSVVSAPVISSFTVTDNVAPNSVGKSGDNLTFVVTLSEAVTVVTTGGTPSIIFSVNGVAVTATYASGSGASMLTFTGSTVPATGNGTAISITSIALNGGTVTGNLSTQGLMTTSVGQTYAGYTVDNSLPAAPTLMLLSDTGFSNNDSLTNNPTILVNGLETTAGTSWQYQVDGTAVGSWMTGSGTSFTATTGPHSYFVRQTDAAGNVSLASTAVNYTVDISAPVAPTLRLVVDDGLSTSDGITSNPSVSVSGLESSSGTTWAYQVDGTTGVWIVGTSSSFTATSGDHNYFVRQTDAAGNIGPISTARYAVYLSANTPTLMLASDTGSNPNDRVTNNPTVNVLGLGLGSTWSYQVDGAATSWTVGSGSSFTALSGIHSYIVQQVDAIGHTSAISTAVIYTLDTTPPLALSLSLASDTGSSASDNLTSNSTIYVNGLISGNTWAYQVDGTTGSWITGSGSSFNATSGPHSYFVQQIDLAGNTSLLNPVASYTLDTSAPSALGTSGTTSNVAENTLGTVTLTANANDISAGASVTWSLGTGADTALFNLNSGVLSFKSLPDYEMPRGLPVNAGTNNNAYTVNVIATDMAGNVATKAIIVNVIDVNERPQTVGSLPNLFASLDGAYQFDANNYFSDPDSVNTYAIAAPKWGTLTYSNTGLPAGLIIDSATGVISGTATATTAVAGVPVTITATDGGGLSVTQTFNFSVVDQPLVLGFRVVDGTSSNGTSLGRSGESLTFTLTMSEAVIVNTSAGTPAVTFSMNGQSVTAGYVSGTGSATLVFNGPSVVVPATGDGNSTVLQSISLNGGTVVSSRDSSHSWYTSAVGQIYSAYTVDNTALPPTLMLASDTGFSASDRITNNPTIKVLGLENGATWTYQVNGSGSWLTGAGSSLMALSGSNSYSVQQVDVAGNTSLPSPVAIYTFDNNIPAVPTLSLVSDTGFSGSDRLTSNATINVLNLETTVGSTWAYQVDGTTGNWIAGVGSNFTATAGAHSYFVQQTDVAGNPSVISSAGVYTLTTRATTPSLILASDTGNSGSDALTNNPTVNVLGLDAHAVWSYQVDGTTATWTPGTGSSFNALSGVHSYVVRQVDDAGNTSLVSAEVIYTLDTTPPSTAPSLSLASDTGANPSDNITSNPTILVSGVLSGNTWDYQVDSTAVGGWQKGVGSSFLASGGNHTYFIRQVDAAGNASSQNMATYVFYPSNVALSLALASDSGLNPSDGVTNNPTINVGGLLSGVTWQYQIDSGSWLNGGTGSSFIASNGVHNYTVRSTDVAGNTGAASTPVSFTLDTSISSPSLKLASDTGLDPSDSITSNPTINVLGLEVGSTWQYQVDGGSFTRGSGTSFTATSGAHRYVVNEIDLAGNTINSSPVDYQLYTTINAPTLALVSDTGSSQSDNLTANATVRVLGLAVGATWQYRVDGGIWVDGGTGSNFIATAGAHSYSARQVDLAGNSSVASAIVTYTFDNSTPNAPVLLLLSDTGISNSDDVTSNPTISVSGLSANAMWQYRVDTGFWVTGAGSELIATSGSHSYSVRQTSLAGNVSSFSTSSFTFKASAGVPSLVLASDTGNSRSDGLTNNPTIIVLGLDSGASWAFQVDGGPSWTTGSGSSLVAMAGSHSYAVRQIDIAGNTSLASTPVIYTVDSTVPASPTLRLASDTGIQSTDGLTNNATVNVLALEANANWQYQVDNNSVWITGSASSFTASSGPHSYIVRQIDAAGNTSLVGAPVIYTLDTTLPVAPTLMLASDTGDNSSDYVTSNPTVLVLGLEQASSWQYQVDGAGAWTLVTGSNTFEATAGIHTYVAQQIDQAGNTGAVSATAIYTLQVKATVTPPTNFNVDENSTAVGTLTANQSVTWSLGNSTDAALFSLTSGGVLSFSNPPNYEMPRGRSLSALNTNNYTVSVVATNQAGSMTSQGVQVTVVDVNEAPTASPIPSQLTAFNVAGSSLFSVNLASYFTDPDTAATNAAWRTLTYNSTGLPAPFSINSAGVLSGTPSSVQNISTVTVTATDGGGLFTTQTFTFGVLDKPVISSFTVRDSGATNAANIGKQGEILTFTVLMNEPVNIASGTPSITFSVNNTINIVASYASGSGSNTLIFTATAPNGDGNAISLSSITLNGATITGTVTNQPLGNSPTVGQTYSGYTLDNTLPLAPTLSLASDTGIASSDGITSNATIRVLGLESATGTTWQYQVDATTGSWMTGSGASFTATTGPHSYFVRQIDVAGNIGPNSATSYTLLPTAVTPTLRLASDTGVDPSDGITNNATILVAGLAQVASWQYQIDGSGAWVAGGTGTSFTATSGVHTYVARQIDLAGNTSVPSAVGRYTLDTVIATPSLTLASDTGSQASDFITSNATVLVGGLEQGAIWDYQVDGTGAWILGGVGSSFLASNGIHSYVVRQTDLAGNSSSSAARIYTVYTAIATPTLALASDTGRLSNDNITSNPTILVSGLGAGANFSWRYQVDSNGWINGAGSSFIATNGQHTYRVQQSDVAGNTSALSTAVTYVLDSLAVVPALSLASDTGKSSSDGITSNATINVLGLESAASWRYQVDGASTWLAGTGSSFVASTGAHTYAVQQIDVAGNTSAVSALATYTLDNSAPSISSGTAMTTPENSSGAVTLTATPNDVAASSTVTWSLGAGADTAFFSLSSNGVLSFTNAPNFESPRGLAFNAASNSNVYTVNVIANDLAGNATPQTILYTVTDINERPIARVIPAQLAVNNGAYSLALSNFFTDPDNEINSPAAATGRWGTLTYSASGLPSGFSINSGVITGTATTILSAVTVTVTATDGGGLSSTQTFTLGAVDRPTIANFSVIDSGISGNNQNGSTLGRAGENLIFIATMSESVTVAGGAPVLSFNVNGSSVAATYNSGSGSNILTFSGALVPATGNGTSISLTTINLSGATVTGALTNSTLTATVTGQTFSGYTVDNAPPVAPTLALAVDSGSRSDDRITNNPTILAQGLESGATWQYKVDAEASWTTGSGSSFVARSGTHSYFVQQTDAAGNTSGSSSAVTFVVDLTVANPMLALASDTGLNASDNITNNSTIKVLGLESAATWQYQVDGANSWLAGTGTSFTASTGAHTYAVRQTDVAGNTSSGSVAVVYTLDTSLPGVPVLSLASDTGVSASDNVTGNPTVVVTGLENGTTWQYQVDGAGSWVAGVGSSFNALNGVHTYVVQQIDIAGNSSNSVQVAYTLNTALPLAPVLSLASDGGTNASDGVTGNPTVNVGSLVLGGTWAYQVDGSGSWISGSGRSFTATSGLHSYTVQQTDLTGNTSAAANAIYEIVTTSPTVSNVVISGANSSNAPKVGPLSSGDKIVVTLTLSENVLVNSSPYVATYTINIGGVSKTAVYDAASSSANTMVFYYTVVAGDGGVNGLVTAQSRGLQVDGSVRSGLSGNDLVVTVPGTTAMVTAVAITNVSLASSNNYVIASSVVTATVVMSDAVTVTGQPRLALNIGGTIVQATYAGIDATNTSLFFTYVVLSGQVDSNGISIGANAITLNGGTIRDVSTAGNAILLQAAVQDNPNYLLDALAPPRASLALASDTGSSANDGTTNNPLINVFGLESGTTWQYRVDNGQYQTGTGSSFAAVLGVHSYSVVQTDAAGNISPVSTAVTYTLLNPPAVSNVRVSGTFIGQTQPSEVNDSNPPVVSTSQVTGLHNGTSATSLVVGDIIRVTLTLNEAVTVTGSPNYTINVGGVNKTAVYSAASSTPSNVSTPTLVFTYTVVAGDDGSITTPASPLWLGGSVVRDTVGGVLDPSKVGALGTNALTVTTSGSDATAPSVVNIALSPTVSTQNNPLTTGDVVTATVLMSEAVTVSGGFPQLAMTIGGSTVQASYLTGTGNRLLFIYTILSTQVDTNGISIPANALSLNGSTIRDAAGNSAVITSTAVTDDSNYLVYPNLGIGDIVQVTVSLNEAVVVTGTPSYTINLGGVSKTAIYSDSLSRPSSASKPTLVFTYTVVAGDRDSSGGITASSGALLLGGATVTDLAGNLLTPAALLSSTVLPVANTLIVTTSGSDNTAPSVVNVALSSATDIQNNTLTVGSVVTATVVMSESVIVENGTPQLALTIGSSSVQANYVAGSGSNRLTFAYTILSAQTDTNGISIASNALSSNGSTIRDAANNNAVLTFNAVADNANYLVNTTPVGATPPPTSPNLLLASDTGSNSSDGMTLNPTVQVAGLVNGASWQYQVDSGNWLNGVGSSFLAIAGQHTYNVRQLDSSGNTSLPRPVQIYVLDTVAPVMNTVTISGVDSSGTPKSTELGAGDKIKVSVTFSEPIAVVGTPTYTISLGGTSRLANFESYLNSTAVFYYTLAAGEVGDSVISVPDNGLNAPSGSGVFDVAGNLATNRLDTIAPTVLGVSITSASATRNGILVVGSVVTATVTMSEATFVTNSVVSYDPELTLNIGGTRVLATYQRGSGTNRLVFVYTLDSITPNDASGISIDANALSLNNERFLDAAGNIARLDHLAVTDNAKYVVKTSVVAPVLTLTPDTGVSSNDGISNSILAVVNVNAIESGATWAYRVDNSATWINGVGNSFNVLRGLHTYTVRQTDFAGNTGQTVTQYNLDTVAPLAPSLGGTASILYNNFGVPKVLFPVVDVPVDDDIAILTINISGADGSANDVMILGSALNKDINSVAGSGTTTVNWSVINPGGSGTTGYATQVAWNYTSDGTFTLSKVGGGVFTGNEIQAIEEHLIFQTNSGALSGTRGFALSYSDVAGNVSATTVRNVVVAPVLLSLDLDGLSSGNGYLQGITRALSLNGTTSFATLPNNFQLGGDFTLELWANPSASTVSGGGILLEFSTVAGAYIRLGFSDSSNAAGAGRLYLETSQTVVNNVTSSRVLLANEWSHLAVTVDAANVVKLYVNGSLAGSGELLGGAIPNVTRDDVLLGKGKAGAYWGGQVRDVRVYDSARALSDIASDMAGNIVTSETSLQLAYAFKDSSSAVSSRVDATLSGGAAVVLQNYSLDNSLSPANLTLFSGTVANVKVTVPATSIRDASAEVLRVGETNIAANGSTTNGSVTVATDNWNWSYNSNVFTFSLNGSNATPSQAQSLIRSFGYRNTASPFTNGDREFYITVTDSSGNVSELANARIDLSPPTPPALSFTGALSVGSVVNSEQATSATGIVNVVTSGLDSAFATVTFTGSAGSVKKTLPVVTNITQTVTLSASDLTQIGDGTVNVTATISDLAGNQSAATSSSSFVLRTSPPGGTPSVAFALPTLTSFVDGTVTLLGVGDAANILLSGGNSVSASAISGGLSPVWVKSTVMQNAWISRNYDGGITKINVIWLRDSSMTLGSVEYYRIAASQTGDISSASLQTVNFGIFGTPALPVNWSLGDVQKYQYTNVLVNRLQNSGVLLTNDTGVSASDGNSTDGRITFAITPPNANDRWQYSTDGGVTWTNGVAPVNSISSLTLVPGTYASGAIKVRYQDAAGNVGTSLSNTAPIVIDQTPPAMPAVDIALGVNELGVGINQAQALTGLLMVTAENGTTVSVTFSRASGVNTVSKTFMATGSAQAITLTASEVTGLGSGNITVLARATDVAGNIGSTNTLNLVFDLVRPTVALSLASDTGLNRSDAVTNNPTINVGNLVSGGTWSYQVDGTTPNNIGVGSSLIASTGIHTYTVQQTSASGNVGIASNFVVTLDLSPPSSPVVSLALDNGVPSDNITTNATILVSGLEADASWQYQVDGTAGLWTAGYGSSFIGMSGAHTYNVQQIDLAGNISSSASRVYTINAISPPALALASDTGTIATDGLTNNPTINVSGLSVVGGSWQYQIDGSLFLTGTGSSFTAISGLHTYAVKQLDALLNASDVSRAIYNFDNVAPTIGAVSLSSSNITAAHPTLVTGDVVTVRVDFSEAVAVTGIPTILLNIGSSSKQARYVSGNGTTNLLMAYTIESGLVDINGISLSAGSLTFPSGATITDIAGNIAVPSYAAVTDQATLPVDSILPSFTVSSSTPNGSSSTLTFTFNKDVTGFTANDLTLSTSALRSDASAGSPAQQLITLTPGTFTATDASHYTLVVNGFSGSGTLTASVAANAFTDNRGTGNAALSATASYDRTISLGAGNGQLIKGVQVEGAWYYAWDVNSDGIINGSDLRTYANIRDLFGAGGTATAGLVNGYNLALPSITLGNASRNDDLADGGQTGWRITATENSGQGLTQNTIHEGLSAIWDAFNGKSTQISGGNDPAQGVSGTPPGWNASAGFWSSTASPITPSSPASNLQLIFGVGIVNDQPLTNSAYVAFSVLNP